MLKKLSVFVAICCLATACDDSDSNDSPKAEPVCGNSVVEEGEVCDTKAAEPLTCDKFDANKTWKAGGAAKCSADCKKIEQGTCVEDTTTPDQPSYVVTVTPNPGPETRCDDGKHEAGEVCDPAFGYVDTTKQERPKKTCIVTAEGKCVFKTEDGINNCGNGTLDWREECDDGNTANGDGCSKKCKIEPDTVCKMKNGVRAQVLLVTDGDTLKINVIDDGDHKCALSNGSVLTVRMHGIDSPECLKADSNTSVEGVKYTAPTCDFAQSTNFSDKNKNEKGGYDIYKYLEEAYDAGEFVKNLIYSDENKGEITINCETRSATDATCLTDATGYRYLAYVTLKKDGQDVDLAKETVRAGYAMAYTDFTSQRIDAYCAAEKEAIAAKAGVWNYGDTFKKVVEDNFNADKNRWLLDAKHCK